MEQNIIENPIKEIISEILPPKDNNIFLIENLTDNHKLIILKEWNSRPNNPPGLSELSKLCFNQEFDGRSKPVKLIREFLATRQLKAQAKTMDPKIIPRSLTEEQKEYIANNCKNMTVTEMGRELYDNANFKHLSAEGRQIQEYIDSLPKNLQNEEIKEDFREYKPPKTVIQAAARVNKYILNCIDISKIEKNTQLNKNLITLIKYCHNSRFQMVINSYTKPIYKQIFEDAFIRYLWDKGDEILEEELDLYINLCSDLVQLQKMDEEYNNLLAMQQMSLEDSEGKRLSMSIVDSLDSLRKQIKETEKQQRDLVKDLQGRRSERVENKIKENSSLVQLIDFIRTQERRELFLKLNQARQNRLKEEIKRIESLDDLKMEVWGIHPEEII